MPKRILLLPALFLSVAGVAHAQLISIRTVPISQAHQFDIFPSYTMAMGGVSIAVADSLLDPFTNPAKGSRLGAARFFGSPTVYSVSSDAGGGRTFPLGALAKAGSWHGGVALALQEVDLSDRNDFFFPQPFACPACEAEGIDLGSNERSHGNAYVFAMAGRELSGGVSVGGSLFWSQLHAIDGVDLLYAGSARVKQYGDAVDLRLGLLKEWPGDRSLETMVLYNRYATTHDVFYLDFFWDPGAQQAFQQPRLEQNLDRTNTWGLHVEYEQPISATGWRIGGLATVNLASHPKIPNYEIQNIPRDPGNSQAFNVGVGVAKVHEATTFAVDVVYEPIWSNTWADAAEPIQTVDGGTLPAGGKTIENDFRFSNALLRMGIAQDLAVFDEGRKALGLQLGVVVRNISYSLDQTDNVQLSERHLEEQWVEWSPTWGLSFRFPALEIRYRGSATNGTGRPGVENGGGRVLQADVARAGNIIVAPSGPLTLDEVTVITHQFSLSLPLR